MFASFVRNSLTLYTFAVLIDFGHRILVFQKLFLEKPLNFTNSIMKMEIAIPGSI